MVLSCSVQRVFNLAAAALVAVGAALPASAQLGFGPPVALNSNTGLDSGDDTVPAICADRAGNWVVVWSSTENLGGTIDIDSDIVVSRSSSVPVELMTFTAD